MNLNLLQTFQLVSETLSFTEAAKRLNTVQPAVSRHIRALEEELGFALFERTNKRVALTPEGGRFLEQVSGPLSEIENAIRPRTRSLEPEGEIFFGSTPEAGAIYLWPRILEMQSRYPKLKVHLRLGPSREILEAIQGGDLQIGLVSAAPKSKLFEVSRLLSDSAVLVQSGKSKHAAWQKREELDFVTYRARDSFSARSIRSFVPKRLRPKIRERASVNSHIAMIKAVVQNDWLAVLPKPSALAFADDGDINIVLEDKRPSGLHLVCGRRFLMQPANKRVWRDMLGLLDVAL